MLLRVGLMFSYQHFVAYVCVFMCEEICLNSACTANMASSVLNVADNAHIAILFLGKMFLFFYRQVHVLLN